VDTTSLGLATWRPDSPVFDADGLMVEGDCRDQSSQHNSQGHIADTSSMILIIPRPDSPVFDDQGLLVEGTHRDQSSQQLPQQGDPEDVPTEDDDKIPALVPVGTGHLGNNDEMPRLKPQEIHSVRTRTQHLLIILTMRLQMKIYLVPPIPTVRKIRNHVLMLVLRVLVLDPVTQVINQALPS